MSHRFSAPVSLPSDSVSLRAPARTFARHRTRAGRSKLAATQDAAKAFVGRMDLVPDAQGASDQVAVVGFNKNAWIQAPLGSDAARINRAIDDLALRQAEFTRLDLAWRSARKPSIPGSARRPTRRCSSS